MRSIIMVFPPLEYNVKKVQRTCLIYSSIFTLSTGVMILVQNSPAFWAQLIDMVSTIVAAVSFSTVTVSGVFILAARTNIIPALPIRQVPQPQQGIDNALDMWILNPDFNLEAMFNRLKAYFHKPTYYPVMADLTDKQIARDLNKILKDKSVLIQPEPQAQPIIHIRNKARPIRSFHSVLNEKEVGFHKLFERKPG